MLFLIKLITCIITVTVAVHLGNIDPIADNTTDYGPLKPTRRILKGRPVGDTRPYMVYLRAAPTPDSDLPLDWLCGGVIIHESYVLTSAACIEDVEKFYIVSGTSKYVPLSDDTNECINNGAKKAVWKCVHKSYVYDGGEFDNFRWMIADIAVVKVEDPFNFARRVRGCDFIPKKIAYNNVSTENEKRSYATIAGWGASERFSDLRQSVNSPELMEAQVRLIIGKSCKKHWEERYHFLIDEHMICTRDSTEDEAISAICAERGVKCKEMQFDPSAEKTDSDESRTSRRMMIEPGQLKVQTGYHYHVSGRKNGESFGGFCENDHGGPLIVGEGKTSMVIGVMSACQVRETTNQCYGPFLYTSVFKYWSFISCAIDKDIKSTCRTSLNSSNSESPIAETYFDWSKHKEFTIHGRRQAKVEQPREMKSGADVPHAVSAASNSSV